MAPQQPAPPTRSVARALLGSASTAGDAITHRPPVNSLLGTCGLMRCPAAKFLQQAPWDRTDISITSSASASLPRVSQPFPLIPRLARSTSLNRAPLTALTGEAGAPTACSTLTLGLALASSLLAFPSTLKTSA